MHHSDYKPIEVLPTVIELRVGKEPHEVRAVPWLDMVALEVERDVAERFWVSIDIECPYHRRRVLACVLGLGYLAEEVLGEVRRGYHESVRRPESEDLAVGSWGGAK